MDLTIGSINFCVRSQGSLRFLHPIYSGLSAGKTVTMATSESFVGSSSEANSPVSIKPVESKEDL
jgi:hypothetical protein